MTPSPSKSVQYTENVVVGKLLFSLSAHLVGIWGENVRGDCPVIGGLFHMDCFFLGLS